MVEFAITLPIVLALTFMVIDVGYGYYVQNSLTSIARDTARNAASDPRLNPNYRNAGGAAATAADKAAARTDAVAFANNRIAASPGIAHPSLIVNVNVPADVIANPIQVNISRNVNLYTTTMVPGLNTINVGGGSASFVESSTIANVDPRLLAIPDADIDRDGNPNDRDPSFDNDYDCRRNRTTCDSPAHCELFHTQAQCCATDSSLCSDRNYACRVNINDCSNRAECIAVHGANNCCVNRENWCNSNDLRCWFHRALCSEQDARCVAGASLDLANCNNRTLCEWSFGANACCIANQSLCSSNDLRCHFHHSRCGGADARCVPGADLDLSRCNNRNLCEWNFGTNRCCTDNPRLCQSHEQECALNHARCTPGELACVEGGAANIPSCTNRTLCTWASGADTCCRNNTSLCTDRAQLCRIHPATAGCGTFGT